MLKSYRAIKSTFLIFFSSLTLIFSNWAIGQSEFSGSYKCTARISNGLKKENGEVIHQKFYAGGEFFVTHTSDFSGDIVDSFLSIWQAEDAMKWDYPAKKALVAEVLFEEDELKSGDGWRYEGGSYYFRKASTNPYHGLLSWTSCDAHRFLGNTQTRITCNNGINEAFQMNTTTGEFAYAYLGTLHDPKDGEGYEGDTASVRHGRCERYYP